MQETKWKPHIFNAAKRMWLDGRSGQYIALQLGNGLSSSAVVSKMNREGLARDPAKRIKKKRVYDPAKYVKKKRYVTPDPWVIPKRPRHARGKHASSEWYKNCNFAFAQKMARAGYLPVFPDWVYA